MENNPRKETVATFNTVQWRWMVGELVDSDQLRYEIFRSYGQLFVRLPHGTVEPLGVFLTGNRVGRRIRQLYRQLRLNRLEALDGATIDFYPASASCLGLKTLCVDGGELHGREL